MTELVSMPELELPGFAVCQELGVAIRFPARHPRLIAELQAAKPFDVQIAFKARHHQADRKAVGRPQRFAILSIGDNRLVHDLVGERDAAIDAGAVAALRQHPGRAAILCRRDR